jgi:hypothetical protein
MVVEKAGSSRSAGRCAGGWGVWMAGCLVDGRGLRRPGVGTDGEELTCAVENRGRFGLRCEAGGDRSDGVQNGGVIAIELAGYLGEGERGFLTREVHRELPCMRDPGGSLCGEKVLAGHAAYGANRLLDRVDAGGICERGLRARRTRGVAGR